MYITDMNPNCDYYYIIKIIITPEAEEHGLSRTRMLLS